MLYEDKYPPKMSVNRLFRTKCVIYCIICETRDDLGFEIINADEDAPNLVKHATCNSSTLSCSHLEELNNICLKESIYF